MSQIPVLFQTLLIECDSELDTRIEEQSKCWDLMTGGTLVLAKELAAHDIFWEHERKRWDLEIEIASTINEVNKRLQERGEPPLDFDDDIPF